MLNVSENNIFTPERLPDCPLMALFISKFTWNQEWDAMYNGKRENTILTPETSGFAVWSLLL